VILPVGKSSEFEMPVDKNSEIVEEALSQETHQVPRRSNRKRRVNIPSIQTFAKKSKKSSSSPSLSSTVSVPTLITLPYVATRKLLTYLDVVTLEKLSKTCFYFDQLISGRFITSLDFPLPLNFMTEVATTSRLEKKPLLKISCKKINKVLFTARSSYMFHSQLSLLSLDKVREFDFVPFGFHSASQSTEDFDLSLLCHVERMGTLDNVTKLSILFNDSVISQWHRYLQRFPSLVEFSLTVHENDMCHAYYKAVYLPRLNKLVAASRAPVLQLCVVKPSSRRMGKKVLENSFVEKLVVRGPCSMSLVPVMENLKVVEIKLDSFYSSSCTYWGSKLDDRNLHRDGLCCVNIGTMFDKCPNLEKFMGMEVGSIPKTTFNKWSTVLKKKFYEKYLNQGGTKEFKAWGMTRWFTRRQVLFPLDV